MAKQEYCSIKGFEPSNRTKEYIEQMDHITDMSSVLEKILFAIPFFQIFAGRDSYKGVALASASYNVSTYDWQLYESAVKAIAPIERERLENVAMRAMLDTSGEERKFWECVYNAL
ncbi:hypothetical protein ACTFQF_06155 [Aliivibrio fischeri]|uniref:hypothetical protein n=1 Tax=Aliivibrio fischeri TaxID=668 RepID=UPI0007C4352E|nr:hypothetical protein [Aliivibrio fischeri]MBP3140813.1 hypothetical protein [Aliivibrio fischeri]MBP3155880.1 hypothetical protein [Aliivibrio fischeri]MCE7575269.1 hypothetical protein [Aliivibrio fischeri]